MQLRIIWKSTIGYSQPPEPFTIDVDTVDNAVKVMNLLAAYDQHHHEGSDGAVVDSGRYDFPSAGRLMMKPSPESDWEDWYDLATGECDFVAWLNSISKAA